MNRGSTTVLAMVLFAGTAMASDYSEQPRLPDDMRDLALRAADDLRSQRYDQAVTDYHRMIAKHPDLLYAWDNLGVVLYNDGRLNEARAAFEHAVSLSRNDGFAQTSLGMCFFDQQRFSAAIPFFERAEKLRPENPNLHAFLAQCYAKVGRDEEARKERQIENVQQIDTFR